MDCGNYGKLFDNVTNALGQHKQMHIIPKRNTLKLAKIVSEIQASHSARLINLESNDSIIKFLVGEIANHNDKEPPQHLMKTLHQ